jgi:hypothetical protein
MPTTPGSWFALALVAGLVLPLLWATLDAARYPAAAWREAGHSKAGWVALLAVGTIAIFVGFVAFFVYGGSIRGEVRRCAGLDGPEPAR